MTAARSRTASSCAARLLPVEDSISSTAESSLPYIYCTSPPTHYTPAICPEIESAHSAIPRTHASPCATSQHARTIRPKNSVLRQTAFDLKLMRPWFTSFLCGGTSSQIRTIRKLGADRFWRRHCKHGQNACLVKNEIQSFTYRQPKSDSTNRLLHAVYQELSINEQMNGGWRMLCVTCALPRTTYIRCRTWFRQAPISALALLFCGD